MIVGDDLPVLAPVQSKKVVRSSSIAGSLKRMVSVFVALVQVPLGLTVKSQLARGNSSFVSP